MEEHGYSHVMDDVHFQLLSADISPELLFLSITAVLMTAREPTKRPNSDEVKTGIASYRDFVCSDCYHERNPVLQSKLEWEFGG